MFFGVPVFNIFLGLIAGYYYSKRIVYLKIPVQNHTKIKSGVAFTTALTIAIFCSISGIIVMTTDSVGESLRQILRLKFEITKPMILGVILAGGLTLAGLQYFLTKLTMSIIIKSSSVSDEF